MKSNVGGHSNWQDNNLNAYATGTAIFLQTFQSKGHENHYDNNTIIQMAGELTAPSAVIDPDPYIN